MQAHQPNPSFIVLNTCFVLDATPDPPAKTFLVCRILRAREASGLTCAHFELFNVSKMITADCELGVALFLPSRPLNTSVPFFRARKIWFINRHRDKTCILSYVSSLLGGLHFPSLIPYCQAEMRHLA